MILEETYKFPFPIGSEAVGPSSPPRIFMTELVDQQ